MNIFMTNLDPKIAARDHCDLHRNKMIIETAQMLCTAHRILDGDSKADKLGLYKATHVNHPCNKFVRATSAQYTWTYYLLENLCVDYHVISGKSHSTTRLLRYLSSLPAHIRHSDEFKPVIAAPDEFKRLADEFSITIAYQEFMCHKFHEWMSRDKPLKLCWSLGWPLWLDYDIQNYTKKCGSKYVN